MPHLSLVLLGSFQATLDGQPVTGWKSNKIKALLTYLAVEAGRPHPREVLAGLLWPDYTNASALNNLRDALSALRQAIGDRQAEPPFLLITRDTIQFNTASDCSLDLSGLADLTGLEIDQLEQVASAYRGSFLEGFSCDSAPFEEWVLVKREQMGQQMLAALRRLAEHYEERGEYERAITHARKQLELEPWDEEAHQQLMRALAFNGQRSAALAQYETCRRLLVQELGVKPSEEITALYESIRDGRLGRETSRQADQRRIPAHDPAVLTNVPIPLTSFIGRQREMAEIRRLLSPLSREAGEGLGVGPRLLTLTGAGGCGKTRLAIEVSRAFAAANLFKDGVWWVDLARLNDLALVPQAVATVFDLRESPDTLLISLLTNCLRAKELLLVLDNCEHLIDACAQLAEALLSACPKLEILATSRETLSIGGETTFQVTSLSLPDPSHLPPVDSLLDYEAVRLFVERAATALPGFAATCDNAPAVVQVCCRLDGIPLAIELAAARVKVLRVEQIAARLDNRFALLTNGSRTALPHHMTLRAAIDWSYDLLAEEERSLFRWLAVFAGGWTLEAAEHVVSHLATTHSPLSTTLDLLTALVNKSLVVVEQQDEAARYRMLETIRHYARERLAESGKAELARACHLDFFLQFVEHAEPELRRAEQKLWLDRIEAEHDNLRTALEWSLGQPPASRVHAEMGLRLATALGDFWDRRNYWTEGRGWLDRALAATEGAEYTAPRARAFCHAARIANYMRDVAATRLYVEDGQKLFQVLGDRRGIAKVLLERATLAQRVGDLATARVHSEECLRLFECIQDKAGIADSLHRLGHVVADQGDVSSARSHFSESLRLFRETGDKSSIGILLHDLGQMAFREGDYPAARSLCQEALASERELGYKYYILATLSVLGNLAEVDGDHVQARAFYDEGLALARELDSTYLIADTLLSLVYLALHEGDYERAHRLCAESLTRWQEQRDRQGMARCLAGIASVTMAQGKAVETARLLGAIETPLKEINIDDWIVEHTNHERTLAAVRAQLDEATFDAAWAEGHAMAMEQAIEYALEKSTR